ncbi:hypothetical protein [Flavobacterium sp.]|uniref:hypothetical protein n=1 Tax=Flavobacterium sp. TaxID=239 RepID=UPI003D152964
MESKYCWRCKMNVNMLTDEEFNLCREAMFKGKIIVEQELKRRNVKKHIWINEIKTFEKFRYFLEMYKLITGEIETNPNAIFHHQINQYGKDCPVCSKPYRTPLARYCVNCGYGKEILTNNEIK